MHLLNQRPVYWLIFWRDYHCCGYTISWLDLQQARQSKPVIALEQIRDATLARLTIDANHCLVGSADIRWIL